MEITAVEVNILRQKNIRLLNGYELLIGYAALTFDNVFVCNSISVIWNLEKKKYYIRMPKHVLHNSKTRDTFFAINNDFRRKMERAIFDKIRLNVPDPWYTWQEASTKISIKNLKI